VAPHRLAALSDVGLAPGQSVVRLRRDRVNSLRAGLRELLEGLWSHRGHLSDEGDEVPYCLVIQTLAPRRHCAHLDAVLDRPERLLSIAGVRLGKVGWVQVESRATIGLRHTGCKVAAYAQCCIATGTACDSFRILQTGHVDRSGVCGNRTIAQVLDDRQSFV
jgi:hypothetical protein